MFDNAATFYGTIYAPDAEVSLNNSAYVEGAIVANNVEITNNSEMHYDPSVAVASPGDIGAKFIVQRSQE